MKDTVVRDVLADPNINLKAFAKAVGLSRQGVWWRLNHADPDKLRKWKAERARLKSERQRKPIVRWCQWCKCPNPDEPLVGQRKFHPACYTKWRRLNNVQFVKTYRQKRRRMS